MPHRKPSATLSKPTPRVWAAVRYWLVQAGHPSAYVTFPELLGAIVLMPREMDAIRTLAPGKTCKGPFWTVTRQP
jgi:hypothetical protein